MRGTAAGVRHKDMHPATKARVDQQAEVGRRIALLAQAAGDEAAGDVSARYVARRRNDLYEAIAELVDAAILEGAAGVQPAAEQPPGLHVTERTE